MVQAVEQVHEAGFAHKDVKIENCHFTTNDDDKQVLKLLDFGAAINLTSKLSDAWALSVCPPVCLFIHVSAHTHCFSLQMVCLSSPSAFGHCPSLLQPLWNIGSPGVSLSSEASVNHDVIDRDTSIPLTLYIAYAYACRPT